MLSSRNDSPDCLHPIVDSVSNRLVRFNSARMAVSMADSSRTGFALEAYDPAFLDTLEELIRQAGAG
jgi:hypothetical protein